MTAPWNRPTHCPECKTGALKYDDTSRTNRQGHVTCLKCGSVWTTEVKPGHDAASIGYQLTPPLKEEEPDRAEEGRAAVAMQEHGWWPEW